MNIEKKDVRLDNAERSAKLLLTRDKVKNQIKSIANGMKTIAETYIECAENLAYLIDLKDEQLGITEYKEISGYIRKKLAEEGAPIQKVRYVTDVLVSKYKDDKYDKLTKGSVARSLENLNNVPIDLNQKIDDEKFEELKNNTNDSIPLLAQNDLTFEQVQQLPESEKEEYFEARDKLISEQKVRISNIASNNELKREALGIKTKEEKEKISIVKRIGVDDVESNKSNTSAALYELANSFEFMSEKFEEIAEKTATYPPFLDEPIKTGDLSGILHDVIELDKTVNTINKVLASVVNDKNSFSIMSWQSIKCLARDELALNQLSSILKTPVSGEDVYRITTKGIKKNETYKLFWKYVMTIDEFKPQLKKLIYDLFYWQDSGSVYRILRSQLQKEKSPKLSEAAIPDTVQGTKTGEKGNDPSTF